MKSRMLYDELWRDESFFELSDQARLLFIFLLTSPHVQLIRTYKISDREICNYLGIDRPRLKDLKKEIEPLGIWFFEGYAMIGTNYAVYRYEGGKLEKAKDAQLKRLPSKVFTEYISKIDTLSIPYQYPIDTSNDNESDNDNESEGDSDSSNG